MTISPGNSDALNTASGIAMIVGDFETGKKLGRSMVLVDPLNTGAHMNYGYSAYFAGDLEDAIESFGKVIELNPDAAGLHYYIANILWVQGNYEQALARIQLDNLRDDPRFADVLKRLNRTAVR